MLPAYFPVLPVETMPLLLQDWLYSHDDGSDSCFENLRRAFGVRSTMDPDLPNLWGFKYVTGEAAFGHPLVSEARGIVLDRANGWAPVARPFDKFFNLGEPHAPPETDIAWPSADIFEKFDGTMVFLYNYHNAWRVGTAGSPGGGGPAGSSKSASQTDGDVALSFRDWFWNTWTASGERMLTSDVEDISALEYTFVFELMGPRNQVVVTHRSDRLVLLGARRTRDGSEVGPGEAATILRLTSERSERGLGVARRMEGFGSLEDLRRFLYTVSPRETEGVVVALALHRPRLDEEGEHSLTRPVSMQRWKIKHPGYVALHHLGHALSVAAASGAGLSKKKRGVRAALDARHAAALVLAGEASEVMALLPWTRADIAPLAEAYEELAQRLEVVAASRDPASVYDHSEDNDSEGDQGDTCERECLEALRTGKALSVRQWLAGLCVTSFLALVRRKGSGLESDGAIQSGRARRRDQKKEARGARADAAAEEGAKRRGRQKGRRSKKGVGSEDDEAAAKADAASRARPKGARIEANLKNSFNLEDGISAVELGVTCRFIHGSADSQDVDVCYVVPRRLPPPSTCHRFCNGRGAAASGENRNLVVVENGVVTACFKGFPDEANNAYLRTFPLHADDNTGVDFPITHTVARDVRAKMLRVALSVLGVSIHCNPSVSPEERRAVKSALRHSTSAGHMGRALAALDVGALAQGLSSDRRKTIAFQLGQALALHCACRSRDQGTPPPNSGAEEGKAAVVRGSEGDGELYTKAEVGAAFPDLELLLQRGAWQGDMALAINRHKADLACALLSLR